MERREFLSKALGGAAAVTGAAAIVPEAPAAEQTTGGPVEVDDSVASLLQTQQEDSNRESPYVVSGIRKVLEVMHEMKRLQLEKRGSVDYGGMVRALTKAMMIVNEEHRLTVNRGVMVTFPN